MNHKIRIKLSSLIVALFALYNFVYAFYMAEILTRGLYLSCLLLFFAAFCIYYSVCNHGVIRVKQMECVFELRQMLIIAAVFLVITLIAQLVNGKFESFFVVRLLYLLLPVMIVFCISNLGLKNYDPIIYILLGRMILQFVLSNSGNFSGSNILSISWFDSKSSVFESTEAHELFLMTVLLLAVNKKIPAVISSFLCLLCFKRVTFLFCVASWILVPLIRKRKVPKSMVWGLEIAMLFMPFVMLWLYSDSGNQFFARFGINLDAFVMSRYTLVAQTLQHFQGVYNGYGTIRNYYSIASQRMAQIGTMHCDVLVLYLETGIVGLLVYVHNIISIGKRNSISFFAVVFMLFEIVASHFIEVVPAWTVFLLLVHVLDKRNQASPCPEVKGPNLLHIPNASGK